MVCTVPVSFELWHVPHSRTACSLRTGMWALEKTGSSVALAGHDLNPSPRLPHLLSPQAPPPWEFGVVLQIPVAIVPSTFEQSLLPWIRQSRGSSPACGPPSLLWFPTGHVKNITYMYACMHMYTHIRTHTHTGTYTCTHMNTGIRMHTHAYAHTHTHARTHTHTRACARTHTHTHTHS